MYLTEHEIMSQHEALKETYEYMMNNRRAVEQFFEEHPRRKFNIMGCGSSYMLSKSGQRMFASCPATTANAIAGGDYLINPEYYRHMMEDSIVISLSRSGKTTEMLRAIQIMKEQTNCKLVSFSMQDNNDFMPYSDMDLTMEWCYDKSVCQTRTVTNLYLAMSMFFAFYTKDEALLDSLKSAVELNEEFKTANRPALCDIAEREWKNVVILADGPTLGIAEEGALAFTEIAMLQGSFFHMLDYRHGPKVLNTGETLTIMLLQPSEDKLQGDMVADMKKHGGTVVTVSEDSENKFGSAAHIQIGGIQDYIAWGIPFINIMQITAYEKAIVRGTNPDAPTGLDAYITLK